VPKQLDLIEAIEARDAAMAAVAAKAGSWMAEAMAAVELLPVDWTGTGEAMRIVLVNSGLTPPHHHNAWGALVNCALKRGLLGYTGEVDHMKTKKSHARRSPVLRRTINSLHKSDAESTI
jgi:hypothetical protein